MERTNDTHDAETRSLLGAWGGEAGGVGIKVYERVHFLWWGTTRILSLLLIVACTPQVQSASSNKGSTPSQAELQARAKSQVVSAKGGEWTSRVVATAIPEVSAQPGYHHVVASLDSERSLNCFVYQVPIDAGQAVLRLLRAVSVGLEFEAFEPQSLELISEAPVMWFRGKYHESDTGRPGVLRVVVSPRRQFPVVCTHDQLEESKLYSASVREFLGALRFNKEAFEHFVEPSFYELWKLSDAEGMLGFSIFQMFEESQGVRACLEIGATFRWEGGLLRTTDRVVLENEDEVGLKSGKWLDIASTRPILQVMLERQVEPGFRYRSVSEINGQKVLKQFETQTPLLTSAAAIRRFQEEGAGAERGQNFSLFQFLPAYATDQGTTSLFQFQPGGQRLMVQRGSISSVVELGEDGLPQRIEGQGSQIAHLLFRSGR